MSAMQQLRDSGLFNECDPQENGSVCFTVLGEPGASIYFKPYVRKADELHVIVSALELGRFPNNERLHQFVRQHFHGMVHGAGNVNYSYRLATAHIDELVEIVRG